MSGVSRATAKGLKSLIADEFSKIRKTIPLTTIIAFASDHANFMLGSKDGLAKSLMDDFPWLATVGCICIPHPPYSPDLTPIGFHLFPKMKNLTIRFRRWYICINIDMEHFRRSNGPLFFVFAFYIKNEDGLIKKISVQSNE
jgi:hypothetical protein